MPWIDIIILAGEMSNKENRYGSCSILHVILLAHISLRAVSNDLFSPYRKLSRTRIEPRYQIVRDKLGIPVLPKTDSGLQQRQLHYP